MEASTGTDGTTTATIEVTEPDGAITHIPNLTAFSYSSDTQQVGDPFSVTVPDPRLRYIPKGLLAEGSRVTFSLSSPFVASGAKTKKVSGVIVRREVSVTESGTVITITGADLGWHLVNNDGHLWTGLQGVQFGELANACIHGLEGDSPNGWGFADAVLYDNAANTLAKQHLKQGKQGIVLAQQGGPIIPLMRIQIEPGQKLYDLLSTYTKRLLLFVGVTADGALVVYSPDYSRDPSYQFFCYPVGHPSRGKNNVRPDGIKVVDDITERWTEVTCVGELALPDITDGIVAKDNVNANKFRGHYPEDQSDPRGQSIAGIRLPSFLHRLVFTDGEALDGDFADNRATWKETLGLYNSHVVTFTARHHHQQGIWFESNTMCTLDFPVAGISGKYYVSAVRCDRDEQGDRTHFTCHKPDLLAA